MPTVVEKIATIEAEMARTQKNKATSAHLGMLKAKIAKLKRELLAPAASAGQAGEGFDVTKSGDARVGLIGFPSVGKSTLLSKLTGTESIAANYEFTTLTCIPGTFVHKGCNIQLLDLPGIIEGAKDGRGRGRQVIGVGRTCNLILIVLDAAKPLTHKRLIEHELEGFGIRLNKTPPNITFRQKERGGITLIKQGIKETPYIDQKSVSAVLKEYRVNNADIIVRDEKTTVDDIIDVVEGNRVYMPCIYVLNKVDAITVEELEIISRIPHYVCISAGKSWNLDGLMDKIWSYLDMVRVYTKPKGLPPDYASPVVLPRGKCNVELFCNRIHRGLLKQMKYAHVWGQSVKHNPQKVGKEHMLMDEDVIQIVKK